MLRWTAYKTTQRVGVSGTFNDIQFDAAKGAPSVPTLIRSASFRINTKTVNSNNEARDAKLVNFFFGKLAGNYAITGNVKSADGDDSAGTGVFMVQMNGMAGELPFKYSVEEHVLTLTATMNTDNWKAQPAIASINKACEAKHTGEDGVSKTWPDVDIALRLPLDTECE